MIRRILVLVGITTLGCTGWMSSSEPEPHDDHDEHEPGADEHGPEILHVGADVLRDLRITTAPATSGSESERVTVLGELRVDDSRYAEVGAPVSARVVALEADPGDPVANGAALARMESADLGRARAELAAAISRAGVARRAVDRKTPLAGGAVSTREIEDAEADVRAAGAEVDAAKAAVAAFGVRADPEGGSTFILKTPIAGTVLSRDAHQGEMVDAEDVLFRIADLSRLWLVVNTFERDALRLEEGGHAEVTFAALPNRAFEGQIARVGREVDASSRTVPVRIDLDNPAGTLLPGMSASALLPVGGAAGVVTVPAVAVQRCDAGWCAFLPAGKGKFEQRPVGRGRDLGTRVEVLSGLAAGDVVVVEGAFLLRAEAAKQAGGGDEHEH